MGKRMSFDIPRDLREPLADLGRFVLALGPYREKAVVVGGMVPVIYRHLEIASKVGLSPLTTFDLDIALPDRLPSRESIELRVLLNEAEFNEHMRGSEHPPVTVYQHIRHGSTLGPVYVELLTPLTGKASTRTGAVKRLVEIQPGIEAQVIRYLDLLLQLPLTVECVLVPSLKIDEPEVALRIPHPAMYVVQKLLCRDTRRVVKQEKDLAYIFDVIALFRKKWDEIGEVVQTVSGENAKYAKWIRRARERFVKLFESPTSEGPIAIHRVLMSAGDSTTPTEEAIHRVVNQFLDRTNLR